MKLKLTELTRITWACPVEWEGKTEDGRAVYIRYRWGHLKIYVSDINGSFLDAVNSDDAIFEVNYGSSYDGFMEDSEMFTLTKDVIEMENDHAPSRL